MIQVYLLGYAIGLKENYKLKILYANISLCFGIIGIIVLLIWIAITNPEISFDLTSAEWAIVLLILIAVMGGLFFIGLIFGRLKSHNKILGLIKS